MCIKHWPKKDDFQFDAMGFCLGNKPNLVLSWWCRKLKVSKSQGANCGLATVWGNTVLFSCLQGLGSSSLVDLTATLWSVGLFWLALLSYQTLKTKALNESLGRLKSEKQQNTGLRPFSLPVSSAYIACTGITI